jgi:hypothetical protein
VANFLAQPPRAIVAIDPFPAPTGPFRLVFTFVALQLDRRHFVHSTTSDSHGGRHVNRGEVTRGTRHRSMSAT